MVLGGKIVEKSRFLVLFGGMLFEILILAEFCLIFDDIDDEKHVGFLLLFVSCFMFFLTLETLKIVLPSRRELNFHKITFFQLDEQIPRK